MILSGPVHNVMRISSEPPTHGDSHESARTETVDAICDGSSKVSGIKLDIEGYELHALGGAVETLTQSRPWILIEFNSLLAGTDTLGQWEVHRFLADYEYRAHLPSSLLADDYSNWLPASWCNRNPYSNLLYLPTC